MTVAGYTLGRLLGRGGMSEVYAASHPALGDQLALKLVHGELASDAAVVRLHHPNVVRIHEVGRDPQTGHAYVVMDRIDGDDLATRLRARTLAEDEARAMFAAIADGMHAVHAAGIVHRDLKPANVMLRGDVPLIVDFGIAKSLGAQSALATGRRIGTPAYMAPEQLTGGLVAPCVDVWALGVMMFEAVTGTLPFDDFAEGRAPQLFETAPRAASRAAISPAFDHLIARCLERDPGRRTRSMEAIARELRGEIDVEAERVTQDAGALLAPPLPARQLRVWPWVAGSAAAIAFVVGVLAKTHGDGTAAEADPEPPPAPATPVEASPAPPPPQPPRAEVPATAPSLDVDVRSRPTGALVVVDGRLAGVTPMRLSLPGPTSLVLKKNGHRDAKVRAVRAGSLDVRLVPVLKRRRESLD
jgi:eukaryotic-like serine/threonine-protein kinase